MNKKGFFGSRNSFVRSLLVAALLLCAVPAAAQDRGEPSARVATPHVTVKGNIFGGGNKAAVSSNSAVTINQANAVVGTLDDNGALTSGGDVYGGGALANVGTDGNNTTTVTLTNGIVYGGVYGGGLGQKNGVSGASSDIAALVKGAVTVLVNGGTANQVFGCNNLNGAPQGTVNVNVTGGFVTNVFGGGNVASYTGSPVVSVSGGEVYTVYGGGNEAGITGNTSVTLTDEGIVRRGIYGGCNTDGTVTGDATVSVIGGTVGTDAEHQAHGIFGGGYGQPTRVNGSVHVTIGVLPATSPTYNTTTGLLDTIPAGPTIYGDIYGGSALGNVNSSAITNGVNNEDKTTVVDVLSGSISGSVYGGGLGQKNGVNSATSDIEALVHGAVTVNIGANQTINADPVVYAGYAIFPTHSEQTGTDLYGNPVMTTYDGYVYGCNNLNGSPQSDVTVNIYGTAHTVTDLASNNDLNTRDYAIHNVLGGGNQADYRPESDSPSSEKRARVNVYSCQNTIKQIFGGSNAAYAYGTVSMIEGGRFDEFFGGGNGVVIPANIGNGGIDITVKGGRFGYIFNECNRQGQVAAGATVKYHDNVTAGSCDYFVESHFCSGNHADTYGDKSYTMTCSTTPDEYTKLYAGCRLGTIYGNLTLTVDGGKFEVVYGGSKGDEKVAADIKRYPTQQEITDHPGNYPDGLAAFLASNTSLYGTGGNVTVIIHGGTIGTVYGGCDQNGNVEGNITVIVDDAGSATCPLTLDNIYGGSNIAQYRPLDPSITSPLVELVNGTVGRVDNEGKSVENTGDVFGGGYGSLINVNAGIVTSNPKVVMGSLTMTDTATLRAHHTFQSITNTGTKSVRVMGNIYGGGALATVGNFNRNATTHAVENFANDGGGTTTVEIVSGTVGPNNLQMPAFKGMVFGGGKGVVGDIRSNSLIPHLNYVNTTVVTIGKSNDHSGPLVKGSVYGGAENGHVLQNTHVTIQGGQIGCGFDYAANSGAGADLNRAYTSDEWDYSQHTSLPECHHWDYTSPYSPYDPFADEAGYNSDNASTTGKDGHTFYGNVFGGGSGYFPYVAGKWLESAGVVYGNTQLDITGGHILTSVYGGNELTDVKGNCTVNMSGGTLGVPRTLDQIDNHPVTCYLFGGGKGDQRIFFNTWTKVASATVNVTGGWVYGSIFGGGEDGHVLGNATVTVSGANTKIGTLGTSYVDGNVFGGGRGFSGEALTAGVVGGNITVNIESGTMLGSIYGGGRLASVGIWLVPTTETEHYGKMREGADYGHITINISGGIIGNDNEYVYNPADALINKTTGALRFTEFDADKKLVHTKGGNVFAGAMGRVLNMDKTTVNPLWPSLGRVKQTSVTITGGTIKSNVYGGGEMGSVAQSATVNIQGGTIGTSVGTIGSGGYYFGSVYGGGYGSENSVATSNDSTADRTNAHLGWTADVLAGRVYDHTTVNVTGGTVYGDIYGGGEMASVGYENPGVKGNTFVNIGVDNNGSYEGEATIHGNVYGCNNIAGTPFGNANVNIYKTKQTSGIDGYADNGFALKNVFGGGHEADYRPENNRSTSEKSATVHVYGCNNTIEDLFGGGDAAYAYNVFTIVEGGRFARVFGGGNGEVAVADIGPGGTGLEVRGGKIDSLFGGSNILGSINGPLNTTLTHTGCTDEEIGVFFAGSNRAGIIGNLMTEIACGVGSISHIYGGCNMATITGNVQLDIKGGSFTDVFAGSKGVRQVDNPGDPSYVAPVDASITGNVTLNIYGGTIENAFGGSDAKGNITGNITVNVEDLEGTCALDLTNVYGGGNLAEYIPTNASASSPAVNIKHIQHADGHWIKGNVFGGGLGSSAVVTANPVVTIGDDKSGHYARLITSDLAKGKVFGGGSEAPVTGNPTVIMQNANSVVNWLAGGGDRANVTGSTTVTINNGTVNQDVYGGGALSHVSAGTHVTLNDGTINKGLYGGARGRRSGFTGATDNVEANITGGNVVVEVNGGSVTDVFGCNNLNGAPSGSVTVTVDGGTIQGVYGGGNLAAANVSPNVTVSGGTVDTVFGGGNGYIHPSDNTQDVAANVSGSSVTVSGGIVNKAVYGGCNTKGNVNGNSQVSIAGGTIGASANRADGVFGGGYGSGTEVTGDVTLAYNGGTLYGDLYGGSAKGNVNTNNSNTTTVNVMGGTIVGDVYGGGLGDASNAAEVNGVVTVNIGSGTVDGSGNLLTSEGTAIISTYTVGTAKKGGCIFGGNNVKGMPKGDVTVNIWQTGRVNTSPYRLEDNNEHNPSLPAPEYAIDQVFGGGNEADITQSNHTVTTYIHGCDNTVRRVFGGGNAAVVQNVTLKVDGGRFDTIWGGGNGERATSDNGEYSAHVKGELFLRYGGILNGWTHENNQHGTVSDANPDYAASGKCSTTINEYTGGATSAEHIGSKTIVINCDDAVYRNIYAASKAADFYGDITLIINGGTIGNVFGGGKGMTGIPANVKRFTSEKRPTGDGVPDSTGYGGNVTIILHGGTIENVFGGCDFNGSVEGKVTVIVDSNSNNDCKLVVHNIYGGGNEAAYTPTQGTQNYTFGEVNIVPANYLSTPEIRFLRGTVSKKNDLTGGNVFGGGKGIGATVTANPIVTIGSNANTDKAIVRGNVYGGGEEAAVDGRTTVEVLEANTYVAGDIYGGGDRALVTGNVDVTIGSTIAGPTVHGDVYGGGAKASVSGGTTDVASLAIHDNYHTHVTLHKGIVEGSLYGGGLGEAANPARVFSPVQVTVNGGKVNGGVYGCNNVAGSPQSTVKVDIYGTDAKEGDVYAVHQVFGGGNHASYDSIPVVTVHKPSDCANGTISIEELYGGGNQAQVAGTDVSIYGGNTIGTVYGGGNGLGVASDFTMVSGNTLTNIYGGTIGNVYGGNNTSGNILGTVTVNINKQDNACDMHVTNVYGGGNLAIYAPTATEAKHPNYSPVVNLINGSVENDVFGGGYGCKTDLNAGGITTANPKVVMSPAGSNDFRVYGNIYGGGALASVGSFSRAVGVPSTFATNTGITTVEITAGKVGPVTLEMPTDKGHVYGGGRGFDPRDLNDLTTEQQNTQLALIPNLNFVGTTHVTIGGTALVKGSVYGGAENGHVRGDTYVTIEGGQVGVGNGLDRAYTTEEWDYSQYKNLAECNAWPYGKEVGGKKIYAPYDYLADDDGNYAIGVSADGGRPATYASDGLTFYGMVFGGGSGYFPYKGKSKTGQDSAIWIRSAGQVEGNTHLNITGGHILTCAYGGNELTDVGTYTLNANNEFIVKSGTGHCEVTMTGGTLGVPRNMDAIDAHPVTCYLFGGGKGNQRTFFNQWTNVGSTTVTVSGGWVYGSVFGGAEDGHVTGKAVVNIIPAADNSSITAFNPPLPTGGVAPLIGTLGTSYVDGNVFGGGRGFSGVAKTAGVICGNIDVNISGGAMLGSIYGGGRLASVGTYLVPVDDANYGKIITTGNYADHGLVTINISGGIIGNDAEFKYPEDGEKTGNLRHTVYNTSNQLVHTKGGNVFAGSMGRIVQVDGNSINPVWPTLGRVRSTNLTITGGAIKGNVYGGGEMGAVAQATQVTVNGGTIGSEIAASGEGKPAYKFGSVYGGGYGSSNSDNSVSAENDSTIARKAIPLAWTPDSLAGRVYGTTTVNVLAGEIFGDIYGGGEMASVGYEKSAAYGSTTVNIGNATGGTAILHGRVYGANNLAGTPYGNTNVNIYHTAHGNTPAENAYPTEVHTPAELAANTLTQTYALRAVYGGGNLAAHTPYAANGTTNVTVYYCEENTIQDLFGGGNAASTKNNNLVINGGRIHRLFGGGNGQKGEADVTGTATTRIHGGLIDTVFGGSNVNGTIGTIDLSIDNINPQGGSACENVIGRLFGGSNIASGAGGTLTIDCGDYDIEEIYGGSNLATINKDVTLNIYGGTYSYVYAGSKGDMASLGTGHTDMSADISGNVTLNLYGGTITNAFGGSNVNGNITGLITVNVTDEETSCPLNLTNLYGGSNLAAYRPTDATITSPIVNINHVPNGITGNVFGGGKGAKSTVIASGEHAGESSRDAANKGLCVSNPQVNIGDDDDQHHAKISGTISGGNLVEGTGNVYGGGELSEVHGSTTVNMKNANSVINGNLYGAGKGYTGDSIAANVNVDTYVNITDGTVKKNVYGGAELASVGTFGPVDANNLTKGYTMTDGNTHVTITGGTIGTDHAGLAIQDTNNGNVYGAGYGYVGKSKIGDYTYNYSYYNYVGDANVTIGGTARVYGSVFGGAENGHVWRNTSVKIKDGEIGSDLSDSEMNESNEGTGANIYTGNVYGGGRGISESDLVNHTHSLTAGRVFGNTYVEVSGGIIHHDVFGGGSLASIGDTIHDVTSGAHDIMGNPIEGSYIFDDDMNTATAAQTRDYAIGDPVIGTGFAHVRILGGRIGNTGHNEGSVFGSGRGIAGTGSNSEYYHMAYAHNTLVFIGDTTIENVHRVPDIRGAVFGGGANGHVTQNAHVIMTAGVVGGKTADCYPTGSVPSRVDTTINGVDYYSGIASTDTVTDRWGRMTSGHHTFLGNVYAGGRGVDHNIDDQNVDHGLSRYAGRVFGNAKVEISGGVVYHSVYGGGSMASVGHYTIPSGSTYSIANMVADAGTGKAIVSITGGRIGTNGRNNGHVFGASRGLPGVGYNYMSFVNTTDVTIGGTAEVRGSVFGSGENGHVLDSTLVKIQGNCEIGNGIRKGKDRWINDYVGNVYGGGRGVDLDQNNKPSLTAGWVKNSTHVIVSGGHVHHNVYGGGSLASVGPDEKVGYKNTDVALATQAQPGRSWVDVTGGLIGIVNDPADSSKNLYGNVYGAGRGGAGVGIANGNDWDAVTFVSNAVVRINYTDAPSATNYITGNVYGGGYNGHVNNSTYVTVTKGKIGTHGAMGYGSLEGNVFGGGCGEDKYEAYLVRNGYYITNNQMLSGSGNSGVAYNRQDRSAVKTYYETPRSSADSLAVTDSIAPRSGHVYGNSTVLVNAATAADVQVMHHVYGGGANASVGDYWVDATGTADSATSAAGHCKGEVYLLTPGTGTATVTITGGTIGTVGRNNGMIFGASRGEIGAPKSVYDSIAFVNTTLVTIGTSGAALDTVTPNPLIHGSIYGGGENGHTIGDALVVIHSGVIGNHADRSEDSEGISGAKTYNRTKKLESLIENLEDWVKKNPSGTGVDDSIAKIETLTTEMNTTLDYLSFCGNVYGGGCGTDKYIDPADGKQKYNPEAGAVYGNAMVQMDGGYVERALYGGGAMANLGRITEIVYNSSETTEFALSWPARYTYRRGTGRARVEVTGVARVGYSGKDNGDIFGGSRGEAGDRYEMAPFGNVDSTYVLVNLSIPNTYTTETYYGITDGKLAVNPKKNHYSAPLVAGSVYGGCENGHVIGSTGIELREGIVGHALYGGGKGKGTYQTYLKHITDAPDGVSWHAGDQDSVATIYSLTAGKVYRNTYITMTGGRVIRNIFGGGNMASVGKGNYSGGPGDYRPQGYGEVWTTDRATDPLYDSLQKTGHTYVTVTGGIVGILDPAKPKNSLKDDLPLGNVFGGCRGEAAPSVSPTLSPRYHYAPAFFSGYVNHAHVTIGADNSTTGPRLYGSVYGGGQDGHVRGETSVIVNSGEIGVSYASDKDKVASDVSANSECRSVDNIHWVARGNVYGAGSGLGKYKTGSGESYSTSSGSVTCSTYVCIKGGTVHRSVYGGGSLSSIGPLVLPSFTREQWPDSNVTKTIVVIKGGEIGSEADFNGEDSYGSRVYGASRGLAETNPADFATDWWTLVDVSGGQVHGSVFGGGEIGSVKRETRVKMRGGDVGGNLYGGGRGLSGDSYKNYCDVEETYVNVSGGQVHLDVYGGGRDGHVTGNTHVTISGGTVGDEGYADSALDNHNSLLPTGFWVFNGNVFGGGRGSGDENETDKTLDLYKSCGRVGGNTYVAMTDGMIHGSLFGGGRLALTGVDVDGEIDQFLTLNETTQKYDYDAVNHGFATIEVSGGTIGTDNAVNLLKCDWSVGDIMGSGKGDIDYYDDVDAGRVANTSITVSGSPTIRGSVFGGGEMAGIGWWDDKGLFYDNTGKATVNITGTPTIGLEQEFTYKKPAVGHEELVDRDLSENENPGLWTMYNSDGTLLHTCTGNVYGGSQGDVDITCPHWVSMARSSSSEVTINMAEGGLIRSNVYGGGEQGMVIGNTHVIVLGGTIGTAGLTVGSTTPYNFGDVYGAGYGSDDPADDVTQYEDDNHVTHDAYNDSTAARTALGLRWTADVLAGRVFGNATVDILGGTIHGDIYGGGSMAPVGDEKPGKTTNGNTYVNIGREEAGTGIGSATLHGSVYGANNYSGTPFGNTNVHIYSTAHTDTDPLVHGSDTVVAGDHYPSGLKAVAANVDTLDAADLQALQGQQNADLMSAKRYAIKEVFGGGNKADHKPLNTSTGTTLVHIHYCDQNTVKDVYGGGNAAETQNNHVIIDGGHLDRIFGGGNGSDGTAANVLGTATTDIHGGIFTQVFGGSNTLGDIGLTKLNVDSEGGCPLLIKEAFGGGNNAPSSNGEVTLKCGSSFNTFYAGGSKANLGTPENPVTLTLNVEGGRVMNLFGGCKGTEDTAANVYGDVIVNLYGGLVQNLFGGSDVNGNITGTVTVNVDFDPDYSCADGLHLENVYGGGRNAAYSPTDPYRGSPTVNIKNNRYYNLASTATPVGDMTDSAWVEIQDVFGGGLGATAVSTSYPRVVVGGFPETDAESGRTYPRAARVFGNLYGGGSAAPVVGNTLVIVRDAVVGKDGDENEGSFTSGIVFGGGYGTTAKVTGETYVGIFGLSDIKSSVYGGGNAGIVTGSTELQIGYAQQVFPPEFIAYMDGTTLKGRFQCTTPGVQFSYTRDGSTPPVPATAATLFTEPFEFSWNDQIQIIGYLSSAYGIDSTMIPSLTAFDKATMPKISIGSDNKVTLDGTMGAAIIYTLDGTDPTFDKASSDIENSSTYHGTKYGVIAEGDDEEPFGPIDEHQVVRAISVMRGCFTSDVSYLTADAPTLTLSNNTVTISGVPVGAKVIYTTDGSTPRSLNGQTGASPAQVGTAIVGTGSDLTVPNLPANATFKAIVERPGYMPSLISAVVNR